MVPNRLAIALQEDGWWVRAEIVWGKTNPMPESIGDRPATAHEKVFLLTKSERYAYDSAAVRQVGVPDSVDRYHRGRSDHHKWADGGPGNQTIAKSFEGMAAKNPKPVRGRDTHGRHTMGEELPATERRAPRTPKPAAWAENEGRHGTVNKERKKAKKPRPRALAAAEKAATPTLKNSFARPTNGHAGDRGEKPQHRADREPVEYIGSRNLRNYEPAALEVWEISTAPFSGEFCTACESYFQGPALRRLKVEEVERDGKPVTVRYCTCGSTDHWLSHFATFPPELAARCLRTAPKFCCHVCSTPWERVVEKDFVPQPDVSSDRGERRADQHDASSNWGQTPRGSSTHRTTGFRPTCKCEGSKPAPPRVLDPFGGAGTTALVAWRMQIPSTVIELNAHYARLAMERLKADQGMWSDVRLHEPGPAEQVA